MMWRGSSNGSVLGHDKIRISGRTRQLSPGGSRNGVKLRHRADASRLVTVAG